MERAPFPSRDDQVAAVAPGEVVQAPPAVEVCAPADPAGCLVDPVLRGRVSAGGPWGRHGSPKNNSRAGEESDGAWGCGDALLPVHDRGAEDLQSERGAGLWPVANREGSRVLRSPD